MKVYKVIFAKNEVVLCRESAVILPKGVDIRHEQNNGQLIYAFVRARDMDEAVAKVKKLIPVSPVQISPPKPADPSSNA